MRAEVLFITVEHHSDCVYQRFSDCVPRKYWGFRAVCVGVREKISIMQAIAKFSSLVFGGD